MAIDSYQALKTPTVMLLGASSQIGVFAIPQLILAGFHVLAVSRKGKPEGYPVFKQVEWLSEAEAMKAAHSCEYLLSTGPLELARKFLVSPTTLNPTPDTPDPTPVTPDSIRGPFKSAVIFSSSSVETKQDSKNPNERSQVKGMLDLESELQHMAKHSSTKLVIFRPTLIYGCGLDTNISFLAKWIQKHGHMPVNGNAAGLRQPVHAQDLASVATNALLSEKELADVMFVSGGETLSYSNMVARIFNAMGKPVSLVRLPQWLFMLLVRVAGFFNMAKGTNGEMVKRQRIDLVFDDSLAREMLNYRPRSFSPTSEDFSLPDLGSGESLGRNRWT